MAETVTRSIEERAKLHAALGEPARLAIVDDLTVSDRSPSELARRFGLAGNLLAHHLAVLESAELIERFVSSGDRRRRYVRLKRQRLDGLGIALPRPAGPVLFVCSHNSARSQLAAALWRARTGAPADSAGTTPADRVHPGAVAAAARAGLDIGRAKPRLLTAGDRRRSAVTVTVCDRAHEELVPGQSWWHWSLPDPVESGTSKAFDRVIAELDVRIATLIPSPA